MSTEVAQFPRAIEGSHNLPSLPSIALDVLRLSKDPEAGVQDLTEIVSLDPALASKILKMANSPHHRRGRDIVTMQQAGVVLGMKPLCLLALSFSLCESMPKSVENKQFDLQFYWIRSLSTAVAARGLARLLRLPGEDEAFLCGLMGRIGQLIMAKAIPDDYGRVLETCGVQLPPAESERQVLGFDFHQIGATLLHNWGFPEVFVQTLQCWEEEDTEELSSSAQSIARLIRCGDQIAALLWEPDKGRALQRVHETICSCFGLAAAEVENFIITLEAEVNVVAQALDISIETIDYGQLLDEARNKLVEISVETAMELEQSHEKMKELESTSNTDRLTQIPNRAHFEDRMMQVVDARLSGNSDRALGILLMDVDHFKSFNDTYGHATGDKVLQTVAAAIRDKTRETDFVARYGGEEFIAILPNTFVSDLMIVAERIRAAVESQSVECDGEKLKVTISVGGACVDKITSPRDGKTLVGMADECLYEAKAAGRNRSVCRDVELVPSG